MCADDERRQVTRLNVTRMRRVYEGCADHCGDVSLLGKPDPPQVLGLKTEVPSTHAG